VLDKNCPASSVLPLSGLLVYAPYARSPEPLALHRSLVLLDVSRIPYVAHRPAEYPARPT